MRHRMRHAARLALLLLLALPWPAFAFVPRGGENVGFSEMIHDDLYIAGGTVTVTGTVDGDVTTVIACRDGLDQQMAKGSGDSYNRIENLRH